MWFFRLSPVIISVAILGFPLEPATEFHGPLHADKVQHFLTYGFLALLIALGSNWCSSFPDGPAQTGLTVRQSAAPTVCSSGGYTSGYQGMYVSGATTTRLSALGGALLCSIIIRER